MKFRKDINGLRAIAVIAVVLFHFNPHWVPGGFAGVDVFFVISGFLMTGIIFRGLENNNFSIINFYVARANRIIPALSVVCLVLLVFGWFYLTPFDYQSLGKHVASSVGFISNIIYLREAGYFDAASHSKWLLHTWSLSVEWQFYIVYPIILVLFKKCLSLTNIKRLLVVATVLGFTFSVYATYLMPDAAYFLFPTRAWEMMMGGLAFLYPFYVKQSNIKYLEWLGITLILASYAFISNDNLWPGYLALIPVLGAYFVLIANKEDSVITDNIVAQKVGLWSYSIYLWHWPVVVFGYYFEIKHWSWIGIPLSLVLGFLSYKFVESIRFLKLSSISFKPIITFKPLWISVFIFSSGTLIYFIKPNSYLYPLPDSVIYSMKRGNYPCFDLGGFDKKDKPICQLTLGDKKIVALGDSHMYSSLPGLEDFTIKKGIELLYSGYSGCPPLLGIYPIRNDQKVKNCHNLNKKDFDYIANNKINDVFLAARWSYYTDGSYDGSGIQYLSLTSSLDKKSQNSSISAFSKGLDTTLKFLSDRNINTYLMLQIPMQKNDPDKIYYSSIKNKHLSLYTLNQNSITFNDYEHFQKKTDEIIFSIANKYRNVHVINPKDTMCKNNVCVVGDNLESFYFDDDHLSIVGAKKLVPLFEKELKV